MNTKENHANRIMEIVTDYFMTQRIKPIESSDPAYADDQHKITTLHQMLVTAMKCNQTVYQANTTTLSKLLVECNDVYSGK